MEGSRNNTQYINVPAKRPTTFNTAALDPRMVGTDRNGNRRMCTPITTVGRSRLADAEKLLASEPECRRILTDAGMQLQPDPRLSDRVCPGHRTELMSGTFFEQSIIKDRALMPMCKDCVQYRTKEVAKLARDVPDECNWLCADTCICAAVILTSGQCSWCNVESMTSIRDEYVAQTSAPPTMVGEAQQQSIGMDLRCKCGRMPMDKEQIRCCAVCDGLVRLPLHAIDRTTHLACRVLGNSQYVGDFTGDPNAQTMMNTATACSGHPVPLPGRFAPATPHMPPAASAPPGKAPPPPPTQATHPPHVPPGGAAPAAPPNVPDGHPALRAPPQPPAPTSGLAHPARPPPHGSDSPPRPAFPPPPSSAPARPPSPALPTTTTTTTTSAPRAASHFSPDRPPRHHESRYHGNH